MSTLDSEINMLRIRLAALEEQKRIEAETASEKKAFPLKTLEVIIESYRAVKQGYNNKFQLERWYKAREKLELLGPIVDVLKEIQGRLDALENK